MESPMLNLIGSIAGLAAVAVNLLAVSSVLEISLAKRLALAAIVGAWVGLASDLGASGLLAFSPASPTPLIGVVAATPMLVVGVLALASRGFRSALLAIPT